MPSLELLRITYQFHEKGGGRVQKALRIFFLVLFCHSYAAAGQDVVAVQSIRVKPYEEAIKGFRSVCHSRMQRLFISELGGADVIREINTLRPHMVLAIGRDSLSIVRKLGNIPIVYLMVLNPQNILAGERNITGVSMNISPDNQLKALLKSMPQAKRIGLVYDPEKSASFAREARDAAARMNLTLVAKEARTSKDPPSLIMDMKKGIDVYWMVPDTTVITPLTVEFLLLFSLENNIPLLTFSEKYLEMGAFMATAIDPFDMGAQAGEIANKILQGKEVKQIHQVHARTMVVSTNMMIAGKMGITVNVAGTSALASDDKIIRSSISLN
jgi:putative ABC transport system substrate-binding protein